MQTAWHTQFQGLVLFLWAHGQRTTLQHQSTGNLHFRYAAPFHFVNVCIWNTRHGREIMDLAFYGGSQLTLRYKYGRYCDKNSNIHCTMLLQFHYHHRWFTVSRKCNRMSF